MSSPHIDRHAQTILVVEDAETIRKMVCAMLAHDGYKCLEASDGAEALEIVERPQPIHLILTDVVMPRVGGAELARRIAQIRPEIRIIFMSGYSDDPLLHRVERTPNNFLAKPFTASALMGKVRQVLDEPWFGLPRTTAC